MPSSFAPPPASIANSLGSIKLLQLLMFTFALSQGTILFILGPIAHDLGGIQLLSLFKPDHFRQTVGGWSLEERMRFQMHFMLDFWFHPLVYSTMFASWLTLETSLAKASPLPYALFVAIPIVGALCDVMENSIHHSLVKSFPEASDGAIRLAGFFSLAKWALIVPTGIWCLKSFLARRGKVVVVKAE